MLSDRGVSPDFAPEELDPAWVAGCAWLHLPAYTLLRSPVFETASLAATVAREGGAQVSLDLSSVSAIRALGVEAFRERVAALGPDLVFGNADEVALVSPTAPKVVEKRGADGCLVDGVAYPAESAEVVDTTGAGDALAAGFLVEGIELGLSRGRAVRRPHGSIPGMRIAPEIADALAEHGPVVALETTIVAHGFPAPEGLEVGLACEAAVREAGAVPATIGVLDGEIRVGLTEDELARFGDDARKLGPRDLAACAAQGAIGATTVGGTLTVARAAGIVTMGTGGIGGVHRGWETSLDISADIGALSNTPAIVVAAGAKSILDVPATAELLETFGVPVLGYRTDELPLFYRAEGGPDVSARVESAAEAAQIALAPLEARRLRPPARPPAGREPRRRGADRRGTRRGRQASRPRPGRDALRPRVPAREERRRDGRGEQEARRRECRPGGRGGRGARSYELSRSISSLTSIAS